MAEDAKPELTDAQIEDAAVAEFNQDAGHSEPEAAIGNEADKNKVTEPTPGENPEKPEPSKQGEEAGEESENSEEEKEDGGKKKTRVQQILKDRNQARTDAAEGKQREAQKDQSIVERDQKITDLEEKVQKLTDDESGGGEQKPADKQTDVEKIVRKVTQEELAKDRKITASEKADDTDVAKVIKDHPDAEGLLDDIVAAMKKHPTLSAIGAYHMMKSANSGDDDVEEGEDDDKEKTSSNAKQMKTGARSKSSLRKGKSTKDMSTEDMEAHLRKEQESGNIIL